MNDLINPNEWRVSKSGFSIRTGWGNEKNIIAIYPHGMKKIDGVEYVKWIENAELICELHNTRTPSRNDVIGALREIIALSKSKRWYLYTPKEIGTGTVEKINNIAREALESMKGDKA